MDRLFARGGEAVSLDHHGWLRTSVPGAASAGELEATFSALEKVAEQCEREKVKIKILGKTAPHFAITGGTGHVICPFCRDDVGRWRRHGLQGVRHRPPRRVLPGSRWVHDLWVQQAEATANLIARWFKPPLPCDPKPCDFRLNPAIAGPCSA